MLRCVTVTPLGADVEPEVNCRNATSSRLGSLPLHAWTPSSTSSLSYTCTPGACLANIDAARWRRAEVVKATLGEQVLRIPDRSSAARFGLTPWAAIGTGMTPANRQPRKASAKGSPSGYMSKARSPGSRPSSASHEAVAVARAANFDHD